MDSQAKINSVAEAQKKLISAAGTEKIDLLNFLALQFLESNPPQALKYSQSSKELSEELMDAKRLAESYFLLGKSNYFSLDLLSSIENLTNAAKLFEGLGDLENECRALNGIGTCQFMLGDNARALDTLFKGLDVAHRAGEKREESEAMMQIGMIYFRDRENALGFEYLNKCYQIRSTSGTQKDLAAIIGNTGNAYIFTQDYQRAFENYSRCKKIFTEIKNEIGIARAYLNLGIAYGGLEKFPEAIESVNTGLEMFIKLNKQEPICTCYSTLGSIYTEMKDYESAIKYFDKTIELGEQYNFKNILETGYIAQSECYEFIGNYTKALEYLKKFNHSAIQRFQESSEMKIQYLSVAHKVDTFKKETENLSVQNFELNELNKQLTLLNKEKSEFLGIASHDLKNPLASISLSATTLKKHYKNFEPEKIESYLDKIAATSDRMTNIIVNLLNINTIESGEYHISKSQVNLSKLISYITEDFEQAAKQKNIKINFLNAEEIIITTDEQAIHRILENLISNAIKYSNPDGIVNIELSKSDKVIIKITDSGLGIKDEEKERVFQKFPRLTNKPTAGENSTGLGLSIVKRLTELIGGNISFRSEYGKGTTFILELPL